MDRRHFLKNMGWATGSVLLPTTLLSGCADSAAPGLAAGSSNFTARFDHGVASGDPLADRVILWTRVTPQFTAGEGEVPVRYVVATDVALTQVVATATVLTNAARDYTVKVDPTGLSPGTTYYYRFESAGTRSIVGRTRTLPVGPVARLRFAYTSCSNYPQGYFNAYGRIAERSDLDAVFHLGDYLYEGAGAGIEGLNRAHSPAAEIITLADYRQRHAQYRTDPDSIAMHRQHPLICVWDDHESTNDSWRDGADNHTEGVEGSWPERRALSIQAYFEWLPIRLVDASDTQRIWRQFVFGDLVDLLMLDTRLYGRDQQLGTPPIGPETNAPERQLLGPVQEAWLAARLAESTARWKLLGQQVMFAQLRAATLPDVELLGTTLAEELAGINGDQWDGYPAARNRVFDMVEATQLQNLVVLAGDIHASWGSELYRDPGELLTLLDNTVGDPLELGLIKASGVEFVSPSVTSEGFPAQTTALLQTLFTVADPHIKYFDGERHGYTLLDITPERTQAEWWFVDTILEPDAPETFGRALMTLDGESRLRDVTTPSAARENAPAPASG